MTRGPTMSCVRFEEDDFTHDASSKGVIARSVDYGDAARHSDLLTRRLAGLFKDLAALPDISAEGGDESD